MGMQYSKAGVSFDPSVGASANFRWETNYYANDNNSSVTTLDNSFLKTQQEADAYTKKLGLNKKQHGIDNVEYGYKNKVISDKYSWNENGVIVDKNGNELAGLTQAKIRGLSVSQKVWMSPHNNERNFVITLNHELIHVYHHNDIGLRYLVGEKEYLNYTETVAYDWENRYRYNPLPSRYVRYEGNTLPFLPDKKNLFIVPKM